MDSLLTLTTTNQKASAPIKDENLNVTQEETADDSVDFVSILYAQIKSDTKETTQTPTLLSSNTTDISKTDTKQSDKQKSSDEILLDEILGILNQINNDGKSTENFPQFSDNMDKILSDESVKNDFKNVKSLDDVIGLSKKYNLGLENIELSKGDIQEFKKEYKNLDFKNFFDTEDDIKLDNTKALAKIKNPTTDKKAISTDEIMQNNTSTNISKNSKTDENILGNFLKDLDTKKEPIDKERTEINNLKTKDTQIKADIETKDNKVVEDLKQNIDKNSKILNKESTDTKNLDTKEIKTTLTNEVKQQKNSTQKNSEDKILHKIKTEKQTNTLDLNNNQNKSSDHKNEDNSETKPQETKSDAVNQKQEFKNTFQVQGNKTTKQVDTKGSLNQFSNDLKEKMDQYKSPIMKVQMTLSPKNLGEVDVTILNRGNNLHVNITSNSNTMSLFTQNQAEFKNSLVNMGFTNLEMNFSDQGKGSEQNQQNNKKNSDSFEEFSQQENSESTVELIVPRYI